LPATDAVIAQLEVPLDTILHAARTTQGYFCLNAAPAREVPQEILDLTDLLVVNEIEAQTIGDKLQSYKGLMATTYGGRGAVLSRNGQEVARATPPSVTVVDTTGAGDTFTAVLTVALVSGLDEGSALKLACKAGAISTTAAGAQTSPSANELEMF
jgi:ribokinase